MRAGCRVPSCASRHAQPHRGRYLQVLDGVCPAQDPPADAATTDLVQRGSSKAPRAEASGPSSMRAATSRDHARGSSVRSCDWGIENARGPRTMPISRKPSAQAFERPVGNEARGSQQRAEAVDGWLAGVRFYSTLPRGGTLIQSAVCKPVLIPDPECAGGRSVTWSADATPRKRMQTVVQALPEAGFDWADAMRREGDALFVGGRRRPSRTSDLKAVTTPCRSSRGSLDALPHRPSTRIVLAPVNLGSFPLPSPTRINGVREDIRAARQKVLDALTQR